MDFMQYDDFVKTLDLPAPPIDIEIALRALWYDAKGQSGSAFRAAEFGDDYACKRVRAYLYRKAGDVHKAQLWYWRSGAPRWTDSPESEWDDIVKSVLAERPVANAYS